MEATKRQPVAVAACGAVTAAGTGLEALEQALAANTSGLRPCPRHAGRGYQSIVSGCVPDEIVDTLRATQPAFRDARAFLLALSALNQVAMSVRPLFDRVPPSRRALVLSTTKADIEALERRVQGQPCSPAARRHLHPGLLATDLACAMEVTGPVQCVSLACISGLAALMQGAILIGRGRAELVLVAGVDLVSHFVLAGFSELRALEPDGCRPFDKNRLGLSLGEGAGAIALVRRDLMARRAPVILGWGTSNDANHLTGPSRDGAGLALAVNRALGHAGIVPEAVDYVHAHGTGTPYNDNMESLALGLVFGGRVPPFSSSKGLLGHTLGAAGVLETILCLIALRTGRLPGTPRLRERDPVAPSSLVETPRTAARLEHLLKINSGFGGTNGALILANRLP